MVLRCPFLLTCNELPDFGTTDNPAVQRRLAIFEVKPLENPVSNANHWLKKHCMEVFHYVAHELKDEILFSDKEDENEDENEDDDENDDGIVVVSVSLFIHPKLTFNLSFCS